MLIKVLRLVFITITANFDSALSKYMIATVVLTALKLCVPMSQVETISLGVSHMWILDKDDEELVKYVLTPMGGSVVYRATDQPCISYDLTPTRLRPALALVSRSTAPPLPFARHQGHQGRQYQDRQAGGADCGRRRPGGEKTTTKT